MPCLSKTTSAAMRRFYCSSPRRCGNSGFFGYLIINTILDWSQSCPRAPTGAKRIPVDATRRTTSPQVTGTSEVPVTYV